MFFGIWKIGIPKKTLISILDKMLDGISEDELRTFLATLHKLNQNMAITDSEA